MTKIQRMEMEERIKKDDKMCQWINFYLDKLEDKENPYILLGAIRSCLESAGRRKEKAEGIA